MTLSKVREALKPFANLPVNKHAPDNAALILTTVNGGIVNVGTPIVVGDLRRARDALALLSAPEGDRADLVRFAWSWRDHSTPKLVENATGAWVEYQAARDRIEALSAHVRELEMERDDARRERDGYSFLVVEERQRAVAAKSALAEARKVPVLETTEEERERWLAEPEGGSSSRFDRILRDIATLIQHIKGGENAEA